MLLFCLSLPFFKGSGSCAQVSHGRQVNSSDAKVSKCPTTTRPRRERVMVTLRRRGSPRKPTWESSARRFQGPSFQLFEVSYMKIFVSNYVLPKLKSFRVENWLISVCFQLFYWIYWLICSRLEWGFQGSVTDGIVGGASSNGCSSLWTMTVKNNRKLVAPTGNGWPKFGMYSSLITIIGAALPSPCQWCWPALCWPKLSPGEAKQGTLDTWQRLLDHIISHRFIFSGKRMYSKRKIEFGILAYLGNVYLRLYMGASSIWELGDSV